MSRRAANRPCSARPPPPYRMSHAHSQACIGRDCGPALSIVSVGAPQAKSSLANLRARWPPPRRRRLGECAKHRQAAATRGEPAKRGAVRRAELDQTGSADLRRTDLSTSVTDPKPALSLSTTEDKSKRSPPSFSCWARIAYAKLALALSAFFTWLYSGFFSAASSMAFHSAALAASFFTLSSCSAAFVAEQSSKSFGSISMKSLTTLQVSPWTVEFQCERELV